MLEHLLNSKLKRKLLNVFFSLPQRSFAVFELRSLSRGSNQSIGQALRDFTAAGVLNLATKGQRKYYRANPHFRWYDELRDLVADPAAAVEDGIALKLNTLPKLRLAVMSGIFSLQPQVGVDLLLVGRGIDKGKLAGVISDIEKLVGQEVHYTVLDDKEYEHRRLMNDRFIRDILDYPHLTVIDNFKF